MNFDGASVFVTGGSRGIGREIALRFADEGATRVAIGYLRNDKAAESVANELRGRGAEPVLVRGNVASSSVADRVIALGALDALVHSAATGVIRPALETEDKHWDWTLAANARAFLSLVRAAAPAMPSGAAIVGLSSLGSFRVADTRGTDGRAARHRGCRDVPLRPDVPDGVRPNIDRRWRLLASSMNALSPKARLAA